MVSAGGENFEQLAWRLVEGPIWSEKAEGPERVDSRLLKNSHIRVSCNTGLDH